MKNTMVLHTPTLLVPPSSGLSEHVQHLWVPFALLMSLPRSPRVS